uniref:Bladder cancer associated protein n=1 Tax=Sphaeramia orbicularis TaxID=375764 RepID=A0A672ZPR4_9TELE
MVSSADLLLLSPLSSLLLLLRWIVALPVLLIPKPLNPALWFNHSMFMGFYLLSFLLERKPCTICALVFLAALFLICYSCWGNCFLYPLPGRRPAGCRARPSHRRDLEPESDPEDEEGKGGYGGHTAML